MPVLDRQVYKAVSDALQPVGTQFNCVPRESNKDNYVHETGFRADLPEGNSLGMQQGDIGYSPIGDFAERTASQSRKLFPGGVHYTANQEILVRVQSEDQREIREMCDAALSAVIALNEDGAGIPNVFIHIVSRSSPEGDGLADNPIFHQTLTFSAVFETGAGSFVRQIPNS